MKIGCEFICSCLTVALFGCTKGSNDYHQMVPIEDLIENPKSYIGQKIEFVGYAYFHKLNPSTAVYLDKESSSDPFAESVVYLVTNNLKENEELKACSGSRVMAFGVFKPQSDIGFILHVDKGVRVINEQGEVKEYCYKPEQKESK